MIRSLTGVRAGNAEAVRCDPRDPHPPLDAPPAAWTGQVPVASGGAPGAALADVVGLIGLIGALLLARRPATRDSGAPEA